MNLRKAQRDVYLASRLLGDVNATKRGRLPARLIKRQYHRKVISLLRRSKLW